MAPRVTPLDQRFWLKVAKSDGCWLWTASLDISGYGLIRRGSRGTKTEKAHRVSWELTNGPIPAGLLVLHRCDVRACVRPDHLFLGTNQDNTQDANDKGRLVKGERSPHVKLMDADVIAVRRLLASGLKQRDVGARFGISQHLVSLIHRGKHRRST